MEDPSKQAGGDTLILNVGGIRHETLISTLQRLPGTRLANTSQLALHFRPESCDHFFDRHPIIFAAILNFYRTGLLHVPQDVCASSMRMELEYWGIEERLMEDCCWLNYSTQHENDKQLCRFGIDKASQMKASAQKMQNEQGATPLGFRAQVWQLLEEPFSSTAAKVFTVVSIVVTLVSIFSMCAATHPNFIRNMTLKDYALLYNVAEKDLKQDWQGTKFYDYYSDYWDDYYDYNDYEETLESNGTSEYDEDGLPETNSQLDPTVESTDDKDTNNAESDSSGDVFDEPKTRRKRAAKRSLKTQRKNTDAVKAALGARPSRSDLPKYKNEREKLGSMMRYHMHMILNLNGLSDLDEHNTRRRRAASLTETSPNNNSSSDTNHTSTYLPGSQFRPPNLVLTYIDYVCYAFFTLEILTRFLFCPNKLRFLIYWVTWLDLACIVPYYVEVILDATQRSQHYQENVIDGLNALRIFRIFRILRIFRFNKGIRVLGYTLRSSLKEMFLMALFLITGVLFFACLIYYMDRSSNTFQSIPDACWWALITMTTVGYGDIFPTSFIARIIGSLCAISGVLVIGFTVPVIVNNFLLFYTFLNAERFEVHETSANKKVSPAGGDKMEAVSMETKEKTMYQKAEKR